MVELRPWNELLQSLSSNLRSTVRRSLRRFEADGGRCELAGVDDAEVAAKRLVTISREQWRDRWLETGPEHWTSRSESLIVAAARRMTARELGGISEFWRDGEVIISSFWVSGRDFIGTYMLGASREALQHYQWSSLYIYDALNIARSKNCGYLDLCGERNRTSFDGAPGYHQSSSDLGSEFSLLGTLCWVPCAAHQGQEVRAVRERPSVDRWCTTEFRALRRYGLASYIRSGRMADQAKAVVKTLVRLGTNEALADPSTQHFPLAQHDERINVNPQTAKCFAALTRIVARLSRPMPKSETPALALHGQRGDIAGDGRERS